MTIPERIAVDATGDPYYYAYYLEGIRELVAPRAPIFLKAAAQDPAWARVLLIRARGRRIVVDADDGTWIRKAEFAWCNVYGKVNHIGGQARASVSRSSSQPEPQPFQAAKPVLSIGPSFGVRPSPTLSVRWLAAALPRWRRVSGGLRELLAQHYRSRRYSLPLRDYQPQVAQHDYVYHLSTWWNNEPTTNELRTLFLQGCSSLLAKSEVEGGFYRHQNSPAAGIPPRLRVFERTSRATYVSKTKRSAFVFNTPAVAGCLGWKLAEYLALGKAIISTPELRELPAPLVHGTHVHRVEPNQGAIERAILRLHEDPEYRARLGASARQYWEQHLAPSVVVRRLLSSYVDRQD